jgi:hypothetical protein
MSENIGHAYNYLELGNSLYYNKVNYNEAEKYLLNSLRISENSDLEGAESRGI